MPVEKDPSEKTNLEIILELFELPPNLKTTEEIITHMTSGAPMSDEDIAFGRVVKGFLDSALGDKP